MSTAESEGIDPAAIDSLIADIDAGRYGLIDHFLLIRNERVIGTSWTALQGRILPAIESTKRRHP
ncbi:hypothetical protein [Candidatus Palauibacter sp.]|uniref:hypothetical protein n=1 Tax=Candidatus Palauibacter sp. TaxID=3101350 RepID=UPI003B5BF239